MIIELLILTLMQGLLEYLPVSSEGQILLVGVNVFFFDSAFVLSLIFWLHLGTAFTVIVFYHRDIFSPLYARIHSSAEEVSDSEQTKLFGPLFVFVIAGTIGTVLIALPLYFFLKNWVTYLMGSVVTLLVGILLIATGFVLYFQRGAKGDLTLGDISVREAFVIGLLQGIAVLPGISRSAMTLTWLLVRGVNREDALRLSFLLSVPATIGVVTLDFLIEGAVLILPPFILLAIILVAFLTGLVTLTLLRYYAIRVPWWIFCLILGIIVVGLTIPTIVFTIP
ncbi:MAG: undecaprenyl-diphosphate phosphatase [Candidatus Hermodarchaeia archaeon]|jgi:undecaprenyl-diphosphatase